MVFQNFVISKRFTIWSYYFSTSKNLRSITTYCKEQLDETKKKEKRQSQKAHNTTDKYQSQTSGRTGPLSGFYQQMLVGIDPNWREWTKVSILGGIESRTKRIIGPIFQS